MHNAKAYLIPHYWILQPLFFQEKQVLQMSENGFQNGSHYKWENELRLQTRSGWISFFPNIIKMKTIKRFRWKKISNLIKYSSYMKVKSQTYIPSSLLFQLDYYSFNKIYKREKYMNPLLLIKLLVLCERSYIFFSPCDFWLRQWGLSVLISCKVLFNEMWIMSNIMGYPSNLVKKVKN